VRGRGPSVDFRRLGASLAAPGLDTRFWLSMGTVATVSGQGAINDKDPAAVIVGPEGVEVDVVLLPSEDPITCRFPSGGPSSTDDWPIGPGDEVLVAIPEGLPGAGGVILGVLNSASDPLPVEADGKPMFRHDRRLIWANGIPIDLRTGSARITLQGGQQLLGGPDATHPVPKGDDMMAAFRDLLTGAAGIAVVAGELATAATIAGSPVNALSAGFTKLAKAATDWGLAAAAAGNWLSETTKTK
jgi:hypothetical protein